MNIKLLPNNFYIIFSGYYDYDSLNTIIINSNFYYLTRVYIPNTFVILECNKKPIIFLDNNNYNYFTSNKFVKKNISDLAKYLKLKIRSFEKLYSLNNILEIEKLNDEIYQFIKIQNIDTSFLENLCYKKRQIKNIDYEIPNILMACRKTSQAIKETLKNLKKYKYCYDIVNNIKCLLAKENIKDMAYNPICSVREHSTNLHNPNLNFKLKKNDLILLDIGCKYNGYCSDITRTFPYSGKFTNCQTIMYNLVLKVNKFVIKELKEGINFSELDNRAIKLYYLELEKLGIFMEKTNDENKINKLVNKFMPHSIGHMVGIDVHDCGDINILKEGMVITIEPGIYFNKELKTDIMINKKELKKYFDIGGIRIEDTILVTKNGSKILNNITKEIKGLEKLINHLKIDKK